MQARKRGCAPRRDMAALVADFRIRAGADFAQSELTSLSLSDGLEKINSQGFAIHKLTKVTILKSVKTVSWTALAGNELSGIQFDGNLVRIQAGTALICDRL